MKKWVYAGFVTDQYGRKSEFADSFSVKSPIQIFEEYPSNSLGADLKSETESG
jgi:hypothetical protein